MWKKSIQVPETIGTPQGPSVEGASPELLSTLLAAFEEELRKQKVPVDRYMRPGADESEVRAGFAQCGLVAPDEAVRWFGWRDGPTRTKDSHFVMPMFMSWSLAECVAAYLDPKGQPKGYESWQWHPGWIQIMGDANGLALNCIAPPEEAPLVRGLSWGREYGTQPEQTLRQVVSLCTPVAWWLDALQHGWYRWNVPGNAWESVDHSLQPRIRALHALS
jgi:hypothetical protein